MSCKYYDEWGCDKRLDMFCKGEITECESYADEGEQIMTDSIATAVERTRRECAEKVAKHFKGSIMVSGDVETWLRFFTEGAK